MTVTEEGTAVVAAAVAALAGEQRRVAELLATPAGDAWHAVLSPGARSYLVGLGHFPQYAAELDWTPRQVAGHLRDSARIFTERIGRIRAEDEPTLADFVTDAPMRLADYRTTPVERLVAQLHAAQSGLLDAVATVPAGELDRAGVHEVDGRVPLADLLRFLPRHQRDHAEQLTALLAR